MAHSLYVRPLTILLRGGLGAGKTTFTQGLARGLGISQPVTSPTYALEQRYGSQLAHIDLYRLGKKQTAEFLAASEDFPGVRLIEWADRQPALKKETAHIDVEIEDIDVNKRQLSIRFRDAAIPSQAQIQQWINSVCLPKHIRRHTKAVAKVAAVCADDLLKRGIVVRKKALIAAAQLHDLLRFVDFPTLTGDTYYSPTAKETACWKSLKDTYGKPHEQAAQRFLAAHGFPVVGQIIRTHGPHGLDDPSYAPQTIEQKILSYSDKRVMFDKVVSLDQRFDDFLQRYSHHKESDFSTRWRTALKAMEKELFPEGPPV